jgi:hypothetical protein
LSPQVLHYYKKDNYPKNPLQRMKPPRPSKGGTEMILKALKELSRQACCPLCELERSRSTEKKGNVKRMT